MTAHDTEAPEHSGQSRAERLRRAIRLKKAAAGSRPRALPARPPEQPAVLGEMQRGLWLAHQLAPGSPAYNLTSAFRVRGPLDAGRLEDAFTATTDRHRILRSTYRAEGEAVLQVVHPHGPTALERVRAEEGQIEAAATAAARKPFDLESGPLVRMSLVEEAATGERLLLLVLHHILADERSLGFLWREIANAYAHGQPGGPAGSPEGPQYDDYVHWASTGARQQDSGQRESSLDFWRRRLSPPPETLRLPFERPPAEARRFAPGAGETDAAPGRLLERRVSPALREGIRRLAAAVGATPFNVFAFAFRLLLQRYTEGAPVVFATPVSTRSHPAAASMIGYFSNPVVVRTDIDEALAVEPALRRFSEGLREAIAHASVSFQRLAEELDPPRELGRQPVFQSMFVFQETWPLPSLGDAGQSQLEPASLEPVSLDLGASKFDLTLFVTEGAEALDLAVEYRTDRYDEIWMRRLLDHFEALVENLPADLARPTARVPMMGREELGKIAADSRGPVLDPAAAALLPREIFEQARRRREAPAVAWCGGSRSYGELAAQARAIARALAGAGVEPGDRVGIFLDRGPEMILALLGSHGAGAAYVPLDPGYPRARNEIVLEDAAVAAVVTTSGLKDRLPPGPWALIEVGAEGGDLGPEEAAGAVSEDPPALARLSSTSPAYLLYTSGSTGRPKGVVVTHGNLRASNQARRAFYESAPERFLLVPSVAFDSSVAGIFWTLATGGTLIVPGDAEVRDPARLARLIAEERVTGLLCVPSLYAQLIEVGGDLLGSLEIAIVAGEACPPRLVEEHFRALPGARLFNEYGPTEATVWATVQELTPEGMTAEGLAAEGGAGSVPVGRPIPGVRVDVLDALGRRVPAGIPGHAWIAGPTVARGYWRRPALTAERFAAHGMSGGASGVETEPGSRTYRTGDRMAWTPDGRLLFLGRADEQIKLRGFRIEPGEVEAALLRADSRVEEAAVVARSSGAGGRDLELVAFLQGTELGAADCGGSEAGLRRQLTGSLAAHMIPSRLVVLAELPRLPNGKVDRGRLRSLPLDLEARLAPVSGRGDALPGPREQVLISLWEGLLGRFGISSTDNFFELGGHSLLVVEMLRAIERDFEVRLSSTDVFENPTVAELARRIEQRGDSAAVPYQHLFPLQPRGEKAPFVIAVPHFFSEMFASRFRGERPVYGLRGVSLRSEGNRGRWRTLTDLGEDLVEEILRRFPDQPLILAGYSFGASMAIETVRLLEQRGIPVQGLYLIAPMPVETFRLGPLRLTLDGLRRPVTELSTGEALRLYARANHPLTLRLYRRAWRWLAVQPWRHLLCWLGELRTWAGRPLTPGILHADVRVERFRLHSRYRPGRVRTPTTFFNAGEAETDAAATWRSYFEGPFTVVPTPDPHLGEASAEAARKVILSHLENLEDA